MCARRMGAPVMLWLTMPCTEAVSSCGAWASATAASSNPQLLLSPCIDVLLLKDLQVTRDPVARFDLDSFPRRGQLDEILFVVVGVVLVRVYGKQNRSEEHTSEL